jgi:DNA invertase Pin-like site-specific DNA recombinase
MAQYVYARISSDVQTTDGQVLALSTRFPGAQVVTEVASGAKSRPMLKALVDQLQPGDMLIVAALDRLGRKTSEVLALIEDLDRRGVVLMSIREGVDYSTPTGRLVTQILVSVAEMERSLLRERTRLGLAAAKARGSILGRRCSIDPELVAEALRLGAAGHSTREIARRLGMSVSSVGRYLKRARQAAS